MIHEVIGHAYIGHTLHVMHQHFHWRGIKADITSYIGSCDSCQHDNPITLDLPEMQAPAIYGHLWHVHVDLAGPFKTPQYDLNGQHDANLLESKALVVMIVDYFTKLAEFVPVYSKEPV